MQQLIDLPKTCLTVNNAPEAEVCDAKTLDVEPEYQDIEYLDDENTPDSEACPETHCDERAEISIGQNCSNCKVTME